MRPGLRVRTCRPEFLDQQHQRNTHQDEPPQRGKTIEERQVGSLALEKVKSLRLRVNRCVRMSETARGEVGCEVVEKLAVALIEWSRVGHQYALVILRPARQKRGDKRDAETASLISEEICQARGFVVFVLGQIGIRELAHRHE